MANYQWIFFTNKKNSPQKVCFLAAIYYTKWTPWQDFLLFTHISDTRMTVLDSLRIFKPLSRSGIYLSILHAHKHITRQLFVYMFHILATKMYTTKIKREFRSLATLHPCTYSICGVHNKNNNQTLSSDFDRIKCYDLASGRRRREAWVNGGKRRFYV